MVKRTTIVSNKMLYKTNKFAVEILREKVTLCDFFAAAGVSCDK